MIDAWYADDRATLPFLPVSGWERFVGPLADSGTGDAVQYVDDSVRRQYRCGWSIARMTLRKCRGCSYWVEPDARACPNCGIFAPTSETSPYEKDLDDTVRCLSTLLFALAGMVLAVWYGAPSSPRDLIILPTWALSGVLLGWLLGDLVGSILSNTAVRLRNRLFPTHAAFSLVREEAQIRFALAELARREQVLRDARLQMSREPAVEGTKGATAAVEDGARAVAEDAAALHVRLWEICVHRWENQLEWIAVDPGSLSYRECAVRVQALSAATVRIEALVKTWERSVYATTETGRRCILRLREILDRRPALRAALLARTSSLAAGTIARQTNSVETPAPKPAAPTPHPVEVAADQPVRLMVDAEPADSGDEDAETTSTVTVQRRRRRLV